MTFFRVNPYYTDYTLSGYELDWITQVDDLGVCIDPKLKFFLHKTTIVNKARGMLGFIKMWSKEFYDPYVTKTLLISFLRPILEYCGLFLCPQYGVYIVRIAPVQKTF